MAAVMTGYTVENLTPTLEDRNSTYGTLGNPDATFTTGTDIFAKVWDPSATLKIEKMDGPTPVSVVYDGPMSSEINSTGAIVYGYNWGNKGSPPGSGTFRITFTTSDATTIVGVTDAGAEFTEHSTTIFVNLTESGGGGGGGESGELSVTSITPTSGSDSGGTLVTITGTGFVTGAVVTIDGVTATSVSYVDATTITAVTPVHAAGTYDVTVTNPDDQSVTLSSAFSFVAPPSITSVAPISGPDSGGTLVTITGTGFVSGAVVTIDSVTATSVSYVDATTITAVTPAHTAGTHDVTVTNPNNQSVTLSSAFSFVAPPSGGGGDSGSGSDSGGGGGGGGGGCSAGFVFNPNTHKCDPRGQVLGASAGPGQLIGCAPGSGHLFDVNTGKECPATPATWRFAFTKNLWRSMYDQDVMELQKFLVGHGYSIASGVTNYFGVETSAAVRAFQRDHGITQTGFVGPLTRAELNKGL
jgi:hypothetical protein